HHWISVDDGGRIHVVDKGEGPALVLLHGVLLSSSIWVHQFEDLTRNHRVIAIDLRGHGQSLPGRDGFGLPDNEGAIHTRAAKWPGIQRIAADVRQVLDSLEVRDAVVVGHSMGGMVSLEMVRSMPPEELAERISALILVDTTAGPVVSLPGWHKFASATAPLSSRGLLAADRLGARHLATRDLRWWSARFGFGAEAPPTQVRFVEALIGATPSSTFAALTPSLAAFDVSRELDSRAPRSLVIVGSHDHLTPVRQSRRLVETLPVAELVELPRCGHMPMLERRHEFSRLLAEFSDKVGDGAVRDG
ncbi:MAG TPA: alpha/beta hydrolase, partial [Acidimicrobiales bacterium]|nr:alpha/beta hydrolase [Acidimicrobiales bacterium]